VARTRRENGLLVLATALALAVVAAPTPAGLSPAGQAGLAATTFAGVCWLTGALPLSVTALLVPVWLTALGASPSFAAALTGFADPLIFLFLGTFVLADALGRQGVDRRVALWLVAAVGSSPRRVVLALMVATAGLSMLISNTATAALMAPLALGLVSQLTHGPGEGGDGPAAPRTNLHVAALLGVAYAASIGGVGTLIGSPPNAIVVEALAAGGVEVSFVDWLVLGLPIVVVTLPLAWVVLVYWLYPPAPPAERGRAQARARELRRELPPLSATGWRVSGVFALVATLWVVGGLDFAVEGLLPPGLFEVLYGGPGSEGLLYFPLVGLLAVPALVLVGDTTVEDVAGIDWATLVLFGGGISLANALVRTEATGWLARTVFGALDVPTVALVVLVVALAIALSELASNTATAAILAPVLLEVGRSSAPGAAGLSAGVLLALTGGIAASYGFALPVATPPNAIVFGTGEIGREQMLRAGLVLDAALGLVTAGLLVALLWGVGVVS
jgi:sodium-dependent dicarboxylate transporter 2/3/5